MYNYETIRDELKKNKYVIYIVDNNKYELAFKFSGRKNELKEKITKKYLKKINRICSLFVLNLAFIQEQNHYKVVH